MNHEKRLDAITSSLFVSNGAPGGTRTHNPQIRSLILYPVELRAQCKLPFDSLRNIVHLLKASNYFFGASGRIRTDGKGVAVPGLTTWLRMRKKDYRKARGFHQEPNEGKGEIPTFVSFGIQKNAFLLILRG